MLENDLTAIKQFLKNKLAENKIDNTQYIFHYTSPESLLKILENRTMWFSDISFLNDSAERTYIYKMFLDNYSNFKEYYSKDFLKMLRTIFKNYVNREQFIYSNKYLPTMNYYIACFSRNDDCLELWNYYTKNSNSIGYNIKFDKESLFINFPKNGTHGYIKGNIIYSVSKQIELINVILEKYNKYYLKNIQNIKNDKNLLYELLRCTIESFELFNLFFKDLAFENEQEYRIVLFSNEKSEHRTYNGILIPYKEFRFNDDSIKEIMISPNNNKLLEKGVSRFLESNFKNCNIKVSSSKITKRY